MQSVNWWLVALAFVLGLVLTFFLLIRRARREIPVYAPGTSQPMAGAPSVKSGSSAPQDEPYGAGSIRVKATADAPEGGYLIKGNEDSMLYHSTASPSYKQTVAEIWFHDEATAEAAGFHRWDSGKSQRGRREG